MIRRSTWVVLMLFAAVLGIAWYLNRNPIKKEVEAATPTPKEKLFALGSAKITGLGVESKDGTGVELIDSGNETWLLKLPTEEAADNATVNSTIYQLQNADILSRLNPVPNLTAMGLDEPAYLIKLAVDNGQQLVLQVGEETPTKSGYYVRLNNDDPVIVAKFSLSSTLAWIEMPPIAPTPTPTSSNN